MGALVDVSRFGQQDNNDQVDLCVITSYTSETRYSEFAVVSLGYRLV